MIRRYRLLLLIGVTIGQSIAIGVGVVIILAVVGAIDASAAGRATVYLDQSYTAATLDECQRAAPELGRPSWSISQRHWSDVPWEPRVCGW